MIRKPSLARSGSSVTLLVCAALAAIVSSQARYSPSPVLARDNAPSVTIGPYVQRVTPNGVTVMWESNVPCFGEVKLSDGDTEMRRRTEHAARVGEVRIEGLTPDTAYNYSVTLSSSPETTRTGTFRTFPVEPRPLKFIVYGDTRTHPDRHKAVIDAMRRERDVDFVLHTGDLVADGRNLDSWGNEFFGPARAMMSSVPFYTVLGNHERNSPNYFNYLSLPGGERWYSFDVADVHVIALDSNTSFAMGSEQYKWMLADLAEHASARWKFVLMHHPTYTSGPHGATGEGGVPKETPIREAQHLMPMLAKQHGIQAVFAGHDHAYERSDNAGVQYVIAGGGGAPSYGETSAEQNKYRKAFFAELHYCVVSINGDKARVVVKTPAGKVIDKFELAAR